MKKWDEPKIYVLGLEMTMNDNDHNATYHYCHKTDPASICIDKQSDHNASGNKGHIFTGIECKEHIVGGNSACCCYGIS